MESTVAEAEPAAAIGDEARSEADVSVSVARMPMRRRSSRMYDALKGFAFGGIATSEGGEAPSPSPIPSGNTSRRRSVIKKRKSRHVRFGDEVQAEVHIEPRKRASVIADMFYTPRDFVQFKDEKFEEEAEELRLQKERQKEEKKKEKEKAKLERKQKLAARRAKRTATRRSSLHEAKDSIILQQGKKQENQPQVEETSVMEDPPAIVDTAVHRRTSLHNTKDSVILQKERLQENEPEFEETSFIEEQLAPAETATMLQLAPLSSQNVSPDFTESPQQLPEHAELPPSTEIESVYVESALSLASGMSIESPERTGEEQDHSHLHSPSQTNEQHDVVATKLTLPQSSEMESPFSTDVPSSPPSPGVLHSTQPNSPPQQTGTDPELPPCPEKDTKSTESALSQERKAENLGDHHHHRDHRNPPEERHHRRNDHRHHHKSGSQDRRHGPPKRTNTFEKAVKFIGKVTGMRKSKNKMHPKNSQGKTELGGGGEVVAYDWTRHHNMEGNLDGPRSPNNTMVSNQKRELGSKNSSNSNLRSAADYDWEQCHPPYSQSTLRLPSVPELPMQDRSESEAKEEEMNPPWQFNSSPQQTSNRLVASPPQNQDENQGDEHSEATDNFLSAVGATRKHRTSSLMRLMKKFLGERKSEIDSKKRKEKKRQKERGNHVPTRSEDISSPNSPSDDRSYNWERHNPPTRQRTNSLIKRWLAYSSRRNKADGSSSSNDAFLSSQRTQQERCMDGGHSNEAFTGPLYSLIEMEGVSRRSGD